MTNTISHSGAWGMAIIMVVITSWLLYKYLAPKSWREWTSAGVIQAFIIALYAEMYGFPLTIYLLARFFGLDRYNLDANLWSTLVGIGETGMMTSMILGYSLLFIGFGIFFQGWRQVHQARKKDVLVTSGLYRLVRHPQYTGLFLGLFGEGVIHWPTLISIGLMPVIVFAYFRLARNEEKKVIAEFGDQYLDYMQKVPMFIPKTGNFSEFLKLSNESVDTNE